MPLPIVLVIGAVVVGAYKLGRFFKKGREHYLENQLSISDAIHVKEKQELDAKLKKSRKEIIEELVAQ